MNSSTGIKHVENLYIIMIEEVEMITPGLIAGEGRLTPYFVPV